MKFGLEKIGVLCEEMAHPERAFRSIVIAGTNGKGSVTVMVETALRSAGHRAARYTSPHLVRLEERFVIDGRDVETGALRDSVATVRRAVESLIHRGVCDTPPTFFECATAAAFALFRRARVEIAVLEVGLGGRLDATNIATPIATAITSIDFDHQAQLGDTIEAIAREKAGIIKPGIPVVCGPLPPEAEAVVREIGTASGAPVIRALDVVQIVRHGDHASVDVRSRTRSLEDVTMALRGRHQLDNATVAVALLDELADQGITVPDAAVRTGLTQAEWPGRLERFTRGRIEILLDAAHNPAGARVLAFISRTSDGSASRSCSPRCATRMCGTCSKRSRHSARRSSAPPPPARARSPHPTSRRLLVRWHERSRQLRILPSRSSARWRWAGRSWRPVPSFSLVLCVIFFADSRPRRSPPSSCFASVPF